MSSRGIRLALVGVLVATAAAIGAVAPVAGASAPPVTNITMVARSYTPHAPSGGTDDYHCTLVDPHVTHNSFIVSSQFFPNSVEVHHAILFLVPPDEVAAAKAADGDGNGWTCFGETALPGTGLAQIAVAHRMGPRPR
jgi:hypothetical protein